MIDNNDTTEDEYDFMIENLKTKRAIKRHYLDGKIGISDAIPLLRDGFDMMQGEALRYLGL